MISEAKELGHVEHIGVTGQLLKYVATQPYRMKCKCLRCKIKSWKGTCVILKTDAVAIQLEYTK